MSRRAQIRMTPEEIEAFVDAQRTLMVASLDRDGQPHLVPMWFAVLDGLIVFWTYRTSQKVVNLRRDPRLTCLLEDGESYEQLRGVSMQGTGAVADDPDAVLRAGMAILQRYAGPIDGSAREAFEAGVATQAKKRVAVTFHPTKTASWDHRKLAGAY